jgi:hypothetical protein
MILGRTRTMRIFTGLRRQLSAWFFAARNSRTAVSAGHNHQRAPAGSGMFGLLVSSDAARGRWF